MTDLSFYPPAAPAPAADRPGRSAPVLVEVAPPAAQRRVTVAFRGILAGPHLLAVYVLGIAAAAVAVLGWAGALATGRLPRFAAAYLSGYLRWYGRVLAYLLLLTDEYPPFAFADAPYPVRVAASPGRLSRLSVLFRVFLAIPAGIVSLFLAAGVIVVACIAWLAALVTGRLPGPLHLALAAVLRYACRYRGYQCLLTGRYPAGLLGDKPGAGDGSPEPAGGWPLALSPAAKRLVVLILALGALTAVGGGGTWTGIAIHAARVRAMEIKQLNAAAGRHNSAVARHNSAVAREQAAVAKVSGALNQVSAANETLGSQLDASVTDIEACSTLSCMDTAALGAAREFAAFGRALRAASMPQGATAAARRLGADSDVNERDWEKIGSSASFAEYEDTATATEGTGTRFDNDYPLLTSALAQATATLNNQAAKLNAQAATLNQEAAALSRRAAALNAPVRTAHVDEAGNGV